MMKHSEGSSLSSFDTETASLLTDFDLHLFSEGTHCRIHEKMGAQLCRSDGAEGVCFSVWAPHAEYVSVIGDFNNWNSSSHPMTLIRKSGIWKTFIPGVIKGALYKFRIVSSYNGYTSDRSDPFGQYSEIAPNFASIVWADGHQWHDEQWTSSRSSRPWQSSPVSIYELHAGSWKRNSNGSFLNYRQLAEQLAPYCRETGFTHVELLPVMEHPFYGSWGYQTTGYFTPTSRYGSPDDFAAFVDHMHQNGIGVIIDWVPSHFPEDRHALAFFDGTHLFEHADPRQGYHPDWKSCIFNYGRLEVRSFLISSAISWIDRFHIDGIRVDAVASMLYLDYSRKEGEWIPNRHGGRENLEAIEFLQAFNETIAREYPHVFTIAEESTSWPKVSRPVKEGGLGFSMKWDMGWMHDTLEYMQSDPYYRSFNHHRLTFRAVYMFAENFTLPLSHDEVVHGKGSLLAKMPGDQWQKLANLRLLLAFQIASPGKKLLFMGSEFGQQSEWSHEGTLQWHLRNSQEHDGIFRLVSHLNSLYSKLPALHQCDFSQEGFRWIDCNDTQQSVIILERRTADKSSEVIAAFNFTPVPRHGYRFGVAEEGTYREIINTDDRSFGGSGVMNSSVHTDPIHQHGAAQSIAVTLPPLGAVMFVKN